MKDRSHTDYSQTYGIILPDQLMNGCPGALSIPRISRQKWILFLASVAATFLRCPPLFFRPRFWAEEGSVFFAYAFSHPWLETLIRPDGGSYDFFRNLASIVAVHFAPLEWAPLVTTLFSGAIQLIGIAVILTHESRELGSPFRQAVGIGLLLFAATSDEIWLTTLHSQRYFSLIAFLILLDQPNPTRVLKTWFQRVLLLLAVVSGPETSLLAPIFVLNAARERGRENIIHAGIVSAGAIFQFSIFNLFPSEVSRFYPLDLATFVTIIWTKNMMLPYMGMLGIKPLRWANRHFTGYGEQHIFGAAVLLVEVGVFYFLGRRLSSRARLLILGSFVLTTVPSIIFMIGEKALLISEYGGNRYFFVPNFMLALVLLLNIDWENISRSWRSKVCAALLSWGLLMGAYRFALFYTEFSKSDVHWREEVQLWHKDPSHELRIHPDGWAVRLAPRKQ